MKSLEDNKKIYTFLKFSLFIGTIIILLLIAHATQAQMQEARRVPGLIHVKFDKAVILDTKQLLELQDVKSTELQAILIERGFRKAQKIFKNFEPSDTLAFSRITGERVKLRDLSRWYTLQVADTAGTKKFAEHLMKLPGVEAASPAIIMYTHAIHPDDPRYQSGDQWGLNNTSYSGRDIHAADAWEKNKGRNDVIVAVLDTGVDYNHDDLDPGNRSRIIQGYDVADNDGNPMDDLPSSHSGGHGTSVAGVIGAITDNDLKVAGVMWNVKIMPVKIAKTNGPWWDPFDWTLGSIFDGDVGDGIDYARQNGADIINMSFGGYEEWYDILNNPVTEASYNAYLQDILLVAATGNDDTDNVQIPAGFPWVMAVGASTISDQRASFSNYGSHIDVVAPGEDYYSTKRNNSDGEVSGTSFASPMAAGVGGLILSESKDLGLNLTNDDIRQIMRLTADKVSGMGGQNFTNEYGYGRVNANNALTLINSPNIVEHGTKIGGSSTQTWDSHTHTFYRGMGNLASGVYYGVKQYKVTGQVNFSNYFEEPPVVWIRERTSKGWSYANPNLETPWFKITNVTNSGFNFETVVYYIGYNSIGQSIDAYYPVSPSNVKIDYTAVGIPGTPPPPPPEVTISGPSNLFQGTNGSFTANASDGTPPYSYQWYYKHQTDMNWSFASGETSSTYHHTAGVPNGEYVKVVVTDSNSENGEDQHFFTIIGWAKRMAESEIPNEFSVNNNYPNPFNPSTKIQYALPEEATVTIKIYNIMGQEIATLVNSDFSAGYHEVAFEAGNLSSGLYIAKINAIGNSGEQFTREWKMQPVK